MRDRRRGGRVRRPRRVLAIALDPAIDITTAAPELAPGRKPRCEMPRVEPGGGGVSVSRVIKEPGGATTALADKQDIDRLHAFVEPAP